MFVGPLYGSKSVHTVEILFFVGPCLKSVHAVEHACGPFRKQLGSTSGPLAAAPGRPEAPRKQLGSSSGGLAAASGRPGPTRISLAPKPPNSKTSLAPSPLHPPLLKCFRAKSVIYTLGRQIWIRISEFSRKLTIVSDNDLRLDVSPKPHYRSDLDLSRST